MAAGSRNGGRRLSYMGSLDDYDNSSEDEKKKKNTSKPQEEGWGWDLFRHYPPKTKTGSNADMSFYQNAIKALKVVTYLILFTLVLGGGVFAKSSILLATAQIEEGTPVKYCDYKSPKGSLSPNKTATISEDGRIYWYWCVILAFFVPEVMTLLRTVYQLLFKKKKIPFFLDILFAAVVESFHAAAMALLFLLVIPEMDSLLAAAVTSCTCFIPAVLGLLSRTKIEDSSSRYHILMMVGDIIAVIAQLSGIILLPIVDRIGETASWWLPAVLIFASCRWWLNYVSPRSTLGLIRFLSNMKDRLELSRGIVQGMTALCRITVFFGTSLIIIHIKGIEVEKFFGGFPGKATYLVNVSNVRSAETESSESSGQEEIFPVSSSIPLFVFLVHVVASFSAHFAGECASRSLMQKFGLALPVSLTVPSTIVFIFVLSVIREGNVCALHGFLPDYIFFKLYEHIDSASDLLSHWEHWLWIPWLFSQGWVTMHIWTPHCERLAKTHRLFVVSSYDSLIIDQSLMLSRRRDEPAEIEDTKMNDRVTKIYVCATMWHEQADEMMKFINSVIKLDLYRSATKFTQNRYKVQMDDYYELETHVYFDDAFQCMHGCESGKPCHHSENETHVNWYVKEFIKAMESSITKLGYVASPPMKYPAPYGGRLEWMLPGKTPLTVHLKDKNKIRHRKRWSQVMYMYYLLGYRLMDHPNYSVERKEAMAEHTFLLTLDGDIDFDPSALIVLLHLMKRDKELGAACGRIHPMGTGPMVWYQMFEYAIGHWLQKSTEHVIGSVLCSPGAFSLFRAQTLMQDNVMRKYATVSSEARHYVQYDQGEDRWLCTLILQAGGRVEYCAASDSYTHAPETFNEFFNQRRRWIPSTMANMFDLLSTSKQTRKLNENFSWPFVVYEWILMGSTVLGPGTIFLMLVGAFVAAFRIDNWTSFSYNLVPIVIFVIVCFFCKEKTQLLVAGIISAFYGLVMVVVLVGIMIQITEDGWVAPSTILFCVVAIQLVVAGLLHPQELICLVCGIIYYITVPSMYMLLIIYSLFNLNNVSWGTRESKPVAAKNSDQDDDDTDQEKPPNDSEKEVKDKGAIDFSFAGLFRCILCTHNEESPTDKKLETISQSLNHIEKRLQMLEGGENPSPLGRRHEEKKVTYQKEKKADYEKPKDPEIILQGHSDSEEETIGDKSGTFLVSPYWIRDKDLSKGRVEFLTREEEVFWERLIRKYLYPIEEDRTQLAMNAEALKGLRNEFLFKFFMINGLFVLAVFVMQLKKDILHLEWPLGQKFNVTFAATEQTVHLHKSYLKLEPIGCLFIIGFVGILMLQFMAMLVHRFNTFCHVLANTSLELSRCCRSKNSEELPLKSQANEIVKGLQRLAQNNAHPITPPGSQPAAQPNKRKTIHALILKENKTTLAADFDTVFQQNLQEPSANHRLTSMGVSEHVLKAFERRRTTFVERKSQLKHANSSNIYEDPEGARKQTFYNPIPSGNPHTYDNPVFIPDDGTSPIQLRRKP
ncbi:chitin synthase chs-2 [Diachasma alloeum]|uniref:chitin synthase chs-2 n=1 Tax=Diachasma alloeum TaxID=454923 RepID=UPI0007381683|nr:chitin synthase chs-2 [Diachasma alloeum]